MEVHFSPEVDARLDQLAEQTGRAKEEFVCDAVADYFGEIENARRTLDSRYDDIKGGKVELIDGEEAFRLLREKSDARRNQMG